MHDSHGSWGYGWAPAAVQLRRKEDAKFGVVGCPVGFQDVLVPASDPVNTFVQDFLKLINIKREEKHLTQEQLAEMSNLDVRHIQKILAGEVDIRLSTAVSLANALDIDLSRGLTETREHSSSEFTLSVSAERKDSFDEMLLRIRNEAVLEKYHLTKEG